MAGAGAVDAEQQVTVDLGGSQNTRDTELERTQNFKIPYNQVEIENVSSKI